jgi:hypothetical protein
VFKIAFTSVSALTLDTLLVVSISMLLTAFLLRTFPTLVFATSIPFPVDVSHKPKKDDPIVCEYPLCTPLIPIGIALAL